MTTQTQASTFPAASAVAVKPTTARRLFWSVSFGHLTVDTFNGMGSVLLAFMAANVLSLTNTQIGLAISAYQLAGALSQPFFGYWGDKTGGRLLGFGGVAWTVSLLMLSLLIAQLTGSFALMLIPYIAASVGSGAFHPVGAKYAAEATRGQSTRSTAMFFLMGQLGLAIGPSLAGFLLDHLPSDATTAIAHSINGGLGEALITRTNIMPMVALGLIGLPAVIAMAITIPRRNHAAVSAVAGTVARGAFPVKAAALLALVVTLRSLINPGAVAFIPRLFQAKGWDATAYGSITGLFWLGGGLSGLLLGYLAERYDSRWLVAVTMILAAPALFLMASLDGALAFVLALVAGGLSGASHSLLVVQAQRLIPGSKGFASGAILGFMFATGAIGSLIIGQLADQIGLTNAFTVVAAVTVVTGFLGLTLPSDKSLNRE